MYKLLSLCQFGCWIKSSSELWESRNIKYRERKHYFLYYCLSASFLILTLIDSSLIELIYWKKFYVCLFYETLVNCHLAILFRKRNLLSLETYFSEKKKNLFSETFHSTVSTSHSIDFSFSIENQFVSWKQKPNDFCIIHKWVTVRNELQLNIISPCSLIISDEYFRKIREDVVCSENELKFSIILITKFVNFLVSKIFVTQTNECSNVWLQPELFDLNNNESRANLVSSWTLCDIVYILMIWIDNIV